jgi:hypothetical protein
VQSLQAIAPTSSTAYTGLTEAHDRLGAAVAHEAGAEAGL